MVYKINGRISKEDGDWLECPNCVEHGCIILNWFNYCPICGDSLEIEEKQDE